MQSSFPYFFKCLYKKKKKNQLRWTSSSIFEHQEGSKALCSMNACTLFFFGVILVYIARSGFWNRSFTFLPQARTPRRNWCTSSHFCAFIFMTYSRVIFRTYYNDTWTTLQRHKHVTGIAALPGRWRTLALQNQTQVRFIVVFLVYNYLKKR